MDVQNDAVRVLTIVSSAIVMLYIFIICVALVLSSPWMSFHCSFFLAPLDEEWLLWSDMIGLIPFVFWWWFCPILSCFRLLFSSFRIVFVSRRYFRFVCQFFACFLLSAADFDVFSLISWEFSIIRTVYCLYWCSVFCSFLNMFRSLFLYYLKYSHICVHVFF